MKQTPSISLIDGIHEFRIPVMDRGLAYGHGLFETIRVANSKPVQLDFHLQRLLKGALQLNIPLSVPLVKKYLEQLLQQALQKKCHDGVAKLTVTAGVGGRGYQAPTDIKPVIICQWSSLPPRLKISAQQGVKLKLCQHRLSENATLAGLKHLNRLDQVIARTEWKNNDFDEGLMLDMSGGVIECIASNIFAMVNDVLVTPKLDRCGVAGVMRREIIEVICPAIEQSVIVRELSLNEVINADEIFISNALYGVRPVLAIESLGDFHIGSLARRIQTELGRGLPCFLL